MFQDIDEAVEWITARHFPSRGFSAFEHVMASLGNPQDSFRSVHVAGTNGKGSTCCYLRDLLHTKYPKVGFFTSPHLVAHQDRIRINDAWIPDETFLRLLNEHLACIEENALNMFEIDMLLSAFWFQEEQVGIAVYETGLGGRLDPTTTLHHPDLCIITTIGFDHMALLGNTLAAIAGEKAGIIMPHSEVLTGYLKPEAEAVIVAETEKQKGTLHRLESYEDLGPQKFCFEGTEYSLKALPEYQKANASLALKAAELLGIEIHSDSAIQSVHDSVWPGRFEAVHQHPLVILDGAHNTEGMQALTESMRYLPHPCIAVFSALKDKQGPEMEAMLRKACDEVIVTQFENMRADTAEHLADSEAEIVLDWKEAVQKGMELAGEHGCTVVCGSLYLISLVRKLFVSD
ncbi:bifunctional folylpolyglutamate synthase/dihydrofolate synthase [Stecheria intestinalis]|uniref:bifunctional folylpolyglutamate synthase/dihydrofolate synthase n=1 Tax=Stecheria intestinalis TaxID=2606630 RepID=UPI0023F46D63|nr:cyanophycin synthetase [Stecheria intestinalis]MDD5882323.1 cyanophycin synthetase [Stecheria intestinalis]